MKLLFNGLKIFIVVAALFNGFVSEAQEPNNKGLKISGDFMSDERFLLKNKNDWAWNENRLTIQLDKNSSENSKFHSEIWLRNLGLPDIYSSSGLYNKEIVDPYNLEIREAYFQVNEFLMKKLDLKIGRQNISWGTADKLNPTGNLNPYDMEDILDFGRKRGTDAVNLSYYISNDFSVQGVYIPFFRPANLPVGIFSDALNPEMELPDGMALKGLNDTILMPGYNLAESSIAGLRFKGFAKGIDFSLSYVWGLDGLPMNTKNTVIPTDTMGGIMVNSELSFAREHIIGADFSTSIFGMGFWGEGAYFIPSEDVVLVNDFSAFITDPSIPGVQEINVLEKSKPYLKYIIGGDYYFADGSYFNLQYMHGFFHEKGRKNLNDYFFFQYEKRFLNDKLRLAPIAGGLIVDNWKYLKTHTSLIYKPEIGYSLAENAEIVLSAVIFNGKGDNMFARLNDYSMFIFKARYFF